VLSGLTLLTVLANLAALYGMNIWNRALFDGLEKHEASRVLFFSLIYLPIMVASVFVVLDEATAALILKVRTSSWTTSFGSRTRRR
jgi:vitamin B12/bleomycin/antimicrobial peptide transport system ATP-binding/permease protein